MAASSLTECFPIQLSSQEKPKSTSCTKPVAIFKPAKRKEDKLNYFDNFRRYEKSQYVKDISDNLQPEDFIDLKIIRKGNGQQFIKDLIMEGNNDKKELKSSIEYHQKYLNDAGGRVTLPDFDLLKGISGETKFEDREKGQTQGVKLYETKLIDHSTALRSGKGINLIDSKMRKSLGESLQLPEELVPVWKVENRLYDIYFIPGYDNWLVERVRANPDEVHRVSEYKRGFFENLLEKQDPEAYQAYLLTKNNQPARLPSLNSTGNSHLTKTNSLQGYTGHGQLNTTGSYSAKREADNRDGLLVSQIPEQKLNSGTEFWQTTYQNANQVNMAGSQGTAASNKLSELEQQKGLYGAANKYLLISQESATTRPSAGQA